MYLNFCRALFLKGPLFKNIMNKLSYNKNKNTAQSFDFKILRKFWPPDLGKE